MTANVTRRDFLKAASATAASALVVGFSARGSLASMPAQSGGFTPFVKIDPDGQVTAIVKHFETGQGTATGLPTLIAEELNMELDDIAVEFAPSDADLYANLFYRIQTTGGSTSLANSYMQYRKAGAAVREMLISAAAQQWGVDSSMLALSNGMISGSGRSAPISHFVAVAAAMEAPEDPALKTADQFNLIGNTSISRRDNQPKVSGTAHYAMDVHLDGQIVAVVKRSPRFGGKVAAVNAAPASSVPGFIKAVPIPTGDGVVVYASDTWSAFRSRDAIAVEWDNAAAEVRSHDEIKADLLAAVNAPPQLVATPDSDMDQTAGLVESAAQVVEAEFFLPFLCHAPMEPLTCTIEPTADGVILHDGCQNPTGVHHALAAVLQLPLEKIKINTVYAGGSFGRRSTPGSDYQVEAAMAFALSDRDRPVKLVWSREDDVSGGAYRPAVAHKVRVGIDDSGKIVAWDHRIACKPIFKGTPFEPFLVQDGVDMSSVEGVSDTPYSLPGQFVGLTDLESPISVVWWRSVGHSHTGFVMESMMDMAAEAAGRDPLEFRLEYLSDGTPDQQRLAAVLQMAARQSGWDSPVAPDRSRGIAAHKSFSSYVAEVVEISRNSDGAVHVEKVTCAVDCGLAINPDVVKAQMEGGIGYGLGHAMRNEITFNQGAAVERNFPGYPPLRIGDIGQIDVHVMPSAEAPTGVGEPGLPPAAPALANAIAVDGPRVTHLPMSKNGIKFA